MDLDLNIGEVRVLGALVEKQMTTPEYYPMTLNALKNACNQKSNRNPVINFDETTVLGHLDALRQKRLAIVVSGPGGRVRKYEHRLKESLILSQKEMAVMCVLMLRGPQTVGELRSRTERMVSFGSLAEVEEVLTDLATPGRSPQPLVKKLPVLPGQKDNRYIHLLSGEPDLEQLESQALSRAPSGDEYERRIAALEETVEELHSQIHNLSDQFEAFKKQFE